MLDGEFLKNLPKDDIEAIIKLTEEFDRIESKESNIDSVLRAYTAIKALAKNINIEIIDLELVGSKQENISRIRTYIHDVFDRANKIYVSRMLNIEEENFEIIRNEAYEFEFAENDYTKIQELINEIRDVISSSTALTENHQMRLLNKLEKFQSELHKRVSNLDRALGFLLEVNIIVRQTGEAAKPIHDLAKEISKLLTQVILVSKGLPPGEIPPLLK